MAKSKKPGDQKCKCCLEGIGAKDMWMEYYNDGEREVYGEMLTECFALQWEQPSQKPEHICVSCVGRLRDALTFKKEILYTEQLLIDQIKNETNDNVKQEDDSDEIETEYLESVDYLDIDDIDKDKNFEIKLEYSETTVQNESSKKKEDVTGLSGRRRYTEEDLSKCLEAVRSEGMSQTRASIVYHVPRKTISAALANKPRTSRKRKSEELLEQNETGDKKTPIELDKHRLNASTIMKNTNATPFQRNGRPPKYACCFCKNLFLDPKLLKEHVHNSHTDIDYNEICKGKGIRDFSVKLDVTNLQCNICKFKIDKPARILNHLESHDVKVFKGMESRIMPFKFDDEKHVCTICESVFEKYDAVRAHLNLHYRNYVCDLCNMGFVTLGMLRSHMESHKTATYNCDYCDQAFKSPVGKKTHESKSHKDGTKIETKDIKVVKKIGKYETQMKNKIDIEKHRANILTVLENTNATAFGKCSDKGYGCRICEKTYLDAKELKEHTLETHSMKDFMGLKKVRLDAYVEKIDITFLKCNICDGNIENLDVLFEHLEGHGKTIHRDIQNHILPFRFDAEGHVCTFCSRVFHKFKLLREHMNVHYLNYVCEVCEAGFVTRRMQLAHSQNHKTGVFKCDHCPKTFTTKRNKKCHQNMVHVNQNYVAKCGFCGKKFKSLKSKNDHLTKEHDIAQTVISCHACEKTFPTQTLLSIHVKRDHLLERQYKCDDCEMTFFTKTHLRRHSVRHTGVKNYKCHICSKRFGYSKSLSDHLRIHADDRRYECEICPMKFVQRYNWRGHMRRRHNIVIKRLNAS